MAIDLTDKTSNGNDLTNNGAAEVTANLPFAASTIAVDLERGESDYLSIADGDQTGLDFSTTFTSESWLKVEDAPSDSVYHITTKDDAGANRSYSFFYRDVTGTKRLQCIARNGANKDDYKIDYDLGTGTWVHVAVTCDTGNASATTFEFFINGSSQGNGDQVTGDNIATISNLGASFNVGSSSTPSNHFDGQIDEVRLWNDVRTQAEINDNKSQHIPVDSAGLVAYWPWEDLLATVGGNPMFFGSGGFTVG